MAHLDITIVRHYDAPMRTTLTLDDDIADSLREQARLLDKPFKQVVNDTLRPRDVARRTGDPGALPDRPEPQRVPPRHRPLKLNQLIDELEVEDFLEESAE